MAEPSSMVGVRSGGLSLVGLGRAFAAMRAEGNADAIRPEPRAPQVPGYTVTQRLGEGGGGTVYKAYREGSDRPVALKLVRTAGGPGGAAHQRAWRELDILTQLRLPSVPRVIDYGWAEGCLYIAAEFVEGAALDRHCKDGGLDRRARVALLARLADELQGLHERGVIHRDIKPSNVLVDRNGCPVIIDLGIATLRSDDVVATLEGSPIGSPAFMAPEQARGERDAISTRTDVYGLGATAFVVLTGSTPHDTDTSIHEAVRRVAQEPARRAGDVDTGLARSLAAVLDKAVAVRPEDRYSSAAAFGADLRRWLQGLPVLAGTPGLRVRTVDWISRHPAWATAMVCGAVGALTLAGTALATWWLNLRPDQLRASEDSRRVDLVSYGGRRIRTWDVGPGAVINGCQIVDGPPGSGAGRMVLLGLGRGGATDDRNATGLCAYLLDKPEALLWSTGFAPPRVTMPPHENFAAPQVFDLHLPAMVQDVFGAPGAEIVTVFSHVKWSPTAIRVYDLKGDLLWEAWHDGYIQGVYWLSGPRVLLACGVNSEVFWCGRGVEGTGRFPVVVMALRPRVGEGGGWISTPSRAGTVEPVWYKCLLPAEAGGTFGLESLTLSTAEAYDRTRYVELTLAISAGRFVTLTLDGDGNVVARAPSADYGQAVGSGSGLPDPQSLRLGDLPPLVAGSDAFRPANN